MVLSSCQNFIRAPGVALLLRVARLERHDVWMKPTEAPVSLSPGSNGSQKMFSFRRCRNLFKTAQIEYGSHQCPVLK